MRWIPDDTGRFPYRPFFEQSELDTRCEQKVAAFLRERHGCVAYPLHTDDLTVLIEQCVDDLDSCADLSHEGTDVEGLTYCDGEAGLVVRISELLYHPRRINRLRTTLAHELGHVIFHRPLLENSQLPLLSEPVYRATCGCKEATILGARRADWMEWQAGYASGAILMPYSALVSLRADWVRRHMIRLAPSLSSLAGSYLIDLVSQQFQVSVDAARVRLLQLDFLLEADEHSPQTEFTPFS